MRLLATLDVEQQLVRGRLALEGGRLRGSEGMLAVLQFKTCNTPSTPLAVTAGSVR